MNAPVHLPPAAWPAGTRAAFGVDEHRGQLIVVRATRRGRAAAFDAASTQAPSDGLVSVALPQHDSFLKWITAPLASARKAGRVFGALLDVQLPFSVEDCQTALVQIRPTPDGTGTRGLMAGARHEAIARRLDEGKALGVAPHILDHEGLALWSQGLAEFPADPAGLRVLVYLKAERATVVVGQGDQVLGAHGLRQTQADQIIRLVRSYVTDRPAATLWVIMGPAAEPGTARDLFAALADRWPGSMLKTAQDPATFLARALASRALGLGVDLCNLRTGPFLHPTLAIQTRRAPYRRLAAILIASLALIAVNVAWQQAAAWKLAALQRQIGQMAVEVAGAPRLVPRGQEVLGARRALDSQTRDLEPFLASAPPTLTDLLGTVLAIGQAEGVTFETVMLTRKNAVLHGRADDWTRCERTDGRLKTVGNDVKVERKDAASNSNRVAFVISMGVARDR